MVLLGLATLVSMGVLAGLLVLIFGNEGGLGFSRVEKILFLLTLLGALVGPLGMLAVVLRPKVIVIRYVVIVSCVLTSVTWAVVGGADGPGPVVPVAVVGLAMPLALAFVLYRDRRA